MPPKRLSASIWFSSSGPSADWKHQDERGGAVCVIAHCTPALKRRLPPVRTQTVGAASALHPRVS